MCCGINIENIVNIMNTNSVVIILISWLPLINAHSWVECVSYDPVSFESDSLGNYDRSRCSGYPRNFKTQFSKGFGVDTGYNWGHQDCSRDPFNPDDYTSDIPMAKYKAGQTIYISHPSKNHVADTCTNAFIPSTSFVVKMSSQPNVDSFDVRLPLVGGDHVNGVIDHIGFQRCFNFCGDVDKSHCISAWTLPSNIADGRYSFIWLWEFNVNEFYANCFDAYISSDGSISSSMTTTTPSPTPATTTPFNTTIETLAPSPTPATTQPSADTTIETLAPSATSSDNTETPIETEPPQVITSTAPSTSSPFVNIGTYLLNLTGSFDIRGVVNMTISEVAKLRRLL